MAALLLILFLAYGPTGIASVWVGPANAYVVLAHDVPPVNAVAFRALPLFTQMIASLAFLLITGPLISACYYLKALFASYRLGDVFGEVPQTAMRNAAIALIIFAVAPGVLQPLLRAVGSPDRNWFHSHSLAALLVGAVLLVLARVVALGREVEDEVKGFI